MNKIYLILVLLLFYEQLSSQTCCSGGVPLSGNIGFTASDEKTLLIDLSYDYNLLRTLMIENNELEDDSRIRTTQSVLLKLGYSFSKNIGVDLLLTYVQQERTINQFSNTISDKTNGVGDAVLLARYMFAVDKINGLRGQIGLGPKIPLARPDKSNSNGILYNADLQPGSGSWDAISWLYLSMPFPSKPGSQLSTSITYRRNGKNPEYFDVSTYQFGNSFQILSGIGSQINYKNAILNLSLAVKYRQASKDKIDSNYLDNTGGKWLFVVPSLGLSFSQNSTLNIVPEIPFFSYVDGTQLTTSFRLRIGLFLQIKPKPQYYYNPMIDNRLK